MKALLSKRQVLMTAYVRPTLKPHHAAVERTQLLLGGFTFASSGTMSLRGKGMSRLLRDELNLRWRFLTQ